MIINENDPDIKKRYIKINGSFLLPDHISEDNFNFIFTHFIEEYGLKFFGTTREETDGRTES